MTPGRRQASARRQINRPRLQVAETVVTTRSTVILRVRYYGDCPRAAGVVVDMGPSSRAVYPDGQTTLCGRRMHHARDGSVVQTLYETGQIFACSGPDLDS